MNERINLTTTQIKLNFSEGKVSRFCGPELSISSK